MLTRNILYLRDHYYFLLYPWFMCFPTLWYRIFLVFVLSHKKQQMTQEEKKRLRLDFQSMLQTESMRAEHYQGEKNALLIKLQEAQQVIRTSLQLSGEEDHLLLGKLTEYETELSILKLAVDETSSNWSSAAGAGAPLQSPTNLTFQGSGPLRPSAVANVSDLERMDASDSRSLAQQEKLSDSAFPGKQTQAGGSAIAKSSSPNAFPKNNNPPVDFVGVLPSTEILEPLGSTNIQLPAASSLNANARNSPQTKAASPSVSPAKELPVTENLDMNLVGAANDMAHVC
jgi:hypothetical protein